MTIKGIKQSNLGCDLNENISDKRQTIGNRQLDKAAGIDILVDLRFKSKSNGREQTDTLADT